MLRREPWLIVVLGIFGLFCVLAAGLVGYWRYANHLPVYPSPTVVMPVPNAYDDYVVAGRMCQAVGGASVQPVAAAPQPGRTFIRRPGTVVPPPGTPTGQSVQAYDPDVPLAQVRAVVARNRPALSRMRQGFHKAYRSPPVVSFNQDFSEMATYRELARVLLTEGGLAEREGRPADAARSYLDCLRLGVDVPRGGSLIHGMVGLAIQSVGLSGMQRVVDQLDGPSAAAAARQMVSLDAHASSAADMLVNEKEAVTISMIAVLRQSPSLRQLWGTSGGPPIIEEVRFSLTPKKRVIDNYRAYMDALAAGARRPYYAQGPPPPIPNDLLNRRLSGGFTHARLMWTQRDALWRIIEERLAARAYQQEHGALLPSPAALVPAYLPAVPQDPFAPKSLICRQKGAGLLIYSRGPDGVDDGGKDLGARVEAGSNGDIVSVGVRRGNR